MARLLPHDFSPRQLNIVIEELFPNCTEIFYLPSEAELRTAGLKAEDADQYKKKIATFSGQDKFISVYPIFTLPTHSEYLSSKYFQIHEVAVEVELDLAPYTKDDVVECLQLLPNGFIKDLRYGLGIAKDYRSIISAIEKQTDRRCLYIGRVKTGDTDNDIFNLNFEDFDEMRRACNRITGRARQVARINKAVVTHNHIAHLLGNEQKPLPTDNDAISKMLRIKITDNDRQSAMRIITENKSAVEQTDSVILTKLKNDIELVSLERLISTYEDLLPKKVAEETWQGLFNENPFILSLAFGYPAIKISDQASVGGKKLSGDGEKITDYLVKNCATNNLALIEIKKPASPLLNKTAYRGSVFCASKELTGSVTQVLDQCYQLQQNIATIKNNNRIYDIESYAIHCVLVIGTMPSNDDEKKSFEIYRRNSRNVQIITFDELLLKLKQLHQFLNNNVNEEDATSWAFKPI